jgi:hypothetical protein
MPHTRSPGITPGFYLLQPYCNRDYPSASIPPLRRLPCRGRTWE